LGSTSRINSTSERLTRAVLRRCEELGADAIMFDGASLAGLPHFNPESAERTEGQSALVEAVRALVSFIAPTGSSSGHCPANGRSSRGHSRWRPPAGPGPE
jgi:hypothetical protein